jgi:hypothetical protein
MSYPVKEIDEIVDALRHVKLLKMNFENTNIWKVFLIHEIKDEDIIIILDSKDTDVEMESGNSINLKFMANQYEYLVNTKISEVIDYKIIIISLKEFNAQKFLNIRKYNRYDTDLKVDVDFKDGQMMEGYVKNISLNGALISLAELKFQVHDIIKVNIFLSTKNKLYTNAKIQRAFINNNRVEYGIEFIDIENKTYEILKEEIMKYEKKLFNKFNLINKTTDISEVIYKKKILILNYNKFENVDIRETLSKIGAKNYEVLYNFDFYIEYFEFEKPEIVIIDADICGDKIKNTLDKIKSNFPNIKIIVIIPYEFAKIEKVKESTKDLTVLYRPLVYNEFEEVIIWYL